MDSRMVSGLVIRSRCRGALRQANREISQPCDDVEMIRPQCRSCRAPLEATFVDLGMSPLANSLLTSEQASAMEPFYPLHARVCAKCFLVQLEEFESPEHIFSDYLYFSSYSDAWLAHCSRYAEKMIETLRLGAQSKVVEIASNDGYLLQFFAKHGVPVLGIEPARNVAR